MKTYVHRFKSKIKKMTRIKFSVINKACLICLKDFYNKKNAKLLILRRCYHVFHAECLLKINDRI